MITTTSRSFPVRSVQLSGTLPVLLAMDGQPDVLFFGNTTGRQTEMAGALGERGLFGLPAAGGVRDGPVTKYVLIHQQKSMLGEVSGMSTPRALQMQTVLNSAGFATKISANIDGRMFGHTAFVVPIGFALYRLDGNPSALAADAVHLAVDGAGHPRGLQDIGKPGDPGESSVALPPPPDKVRRSVLAPCARYVLAETFGFGADTRAAPDEMHELARELRTAVGRAGQGRHAVFGRVGARSIKMRVWSNSLRYGGASVLAKCDYVLGFAALSDSAPTPSIQPLRRRAALEVAVLRPWSSDPDIGPL